MIGNAVINDGEGIMLIVEKFPWANTLDVTRGVDEAMAELKPGLPGIEIDPTIFRPASFIDQALGNLSNALLLGSVLVFAVLIVFLFEWRTALISLVAIPLSLMAAAMVLYVRDVTINTMILAGFVISVGVVVDDAIIDIENIIAPPAPASAGGQRPVDGVDHPRRRRSKSAARSSTRRSSTSSRSRRSSSSRACPGPSSSRSSSRTAWRSWPRCVVALTVTPAMAYILLRNAPIERSGSPISRRLQERLRPAVCGGSSAAAAGLPGGRRRSASPASAIWPQLGQSLLPDFKERDFLMHWVTAPGTSLAEETRISIDACNELRAIPGVRNCGSHIGQAFQADEPYGVEFGENWISVDPSVDYDKTHATIQEVVDGYPGLRRDVQTYLKERIREVLTGIERCDRRSASSAHDLGRCATLADERRGQARTSSRASSTCTPSSSPISRRSRSRWTWPRPSATA